MILILSEQLNVNTTMCAYEETFVLYWEEVQRVDVDPIVDIESFNCRPYADGSGVGGSGGATGEITVTLRIPASNGGTQDQFQLFLYPTANLNPLPVMDERRKWYLGNCCWKKSSLYYKPKQVMDDALPGSIITEATTNDRLGEYKFTGLTAGEYAIVAAKEGEDFCYSPPITVTIQDESNVFEIDQTNAADITFVNNTSCETSAYNGCNHVKTNNKRRHY